MPFPIFPFWSLSDVTAGEGSSLLRKISIIYKLFIQLSAARTQIFSELCIAEYNPVNNKPVFREKIKIPDSMDFKLWFVPKEVHLSIEPNREFYATYPLNFLMRHAKDAFFCQQPKTYSFQRH